MRAKYVNSKGMELTFYDITGCQPVVFQGITRDNPVNVYTSKGVLQQGVSYHSNTLDVEDLTLRFAIKSENPIQSQELRDRINRVFSPSDNLGYLHYKGRKIQTICTALPYFTENVDERFYEVLVNLQAPNPFWLDDEEIYLDLVEWESHFKFPLIIPQDEGIIFGARTASSILEVNNKGDVDTDVTLILRTTGPVESPIIHNLNTGEAMELTTILPANTTVYITTGYGNKSIMTAEGENLLQYLNIYEGKDDFIQLAPGINHLKYDAALGVDNLDVSIKFNNKYLGV